MYHDNEGCTILRQYSKIIGIKIVYVQHVLEFKNLL